VSSEWVRKEVIEKDLDEKALCSRPAAEQRLSPWDEVDFLRLRLIVGSHSSGSAPALAVKRDG